MVKTVQLEAKVNVANLEKLRTLLLMLEKHKQELPENLVNSINDMLDDKAFEITSKDVSYTADIKSVPEFERIVSVNKYLKCVRYYAKKNSLVLTEAYPENFSLIANGEVVASW